MKTFTKAHKKAKKLRKQNSKDSIVNISKILHILNKEEFDPTTQYNYTQRWDIAVKVANLLTSSTNNTEINHLAWLLLVDDQQAETLRFREAWQWADYFNVPEEIVIEYLQNSFQ